MNKWWRNVFLKVFVGLLAIMFAISAGVSCSKVSDEIKQEKINESTVTDEFDLSVTSPDYRLYLAYENFIDYHLRYGSEQKIKSGEMIETAVLEEAERKFINENSAELAQIEAKYAEELEKINSQYDDYESDEYLSAYNTLTNTYNDELSVFNLKIKRLLEVYKETLVRQQLSEWNNVKTKYDEDINNFYYIIYLVDGTVYSNLDEQIIRSNNVLDFFNDLEYHDTYSIGYYHPVIGYFSVDNTPLEVSEVHIGMNAEFAATFNTNLIIANNPNIFSQAENIFVLSVLGFGVCLIYLMIVAGRKPNDEELHLTFNDYIYMDFYSLIVLTITCVAVLFIILLLESYCRYSTILYTNLVITVCVIAAILAIVLLLYFTTFAKRFKNHTLIKYTFIYMIFMSFVNCIKGIFDTLIYSGEDATKHLNRLLLIVMIVVFIFTAGFNIMFEYLFINIRREILIYLTLWLCVIVLSFAICRVFLFDYLYEIQAIKKGAMIIREGNLSYQIPRLKNKSLNEIAEDINRLSEGLKNSVEVQVASEKTKIELITNVSHDLKTPLTSIISYIDLMSKADSNEEKEQYLEVIRLKSNQLKTLVEDLFEITKVQNGQIVADLQPICINDLMSQLLVEFDEAFVKKGLIIRHNNLDNKTFIMADGNKMYRVISNIINNINKYAMDNTRVYIDYEKSETTLGITFKNIANYEMNFDVNEMNQRFKRGDDSRTIEGNGLGLAIADSFMAIQNGALDISKDGDLFKVTIYIPLSLVENNVSE